MAIVYTNEIPIDFSSGFLMQVFPSCDDEESGLSWVFDQFPHVDREGRKYLKSCGKKGVNPSGTVQFVPADVWALGMVCHVESDDLLVVYDAERSKYVVNLFAGDVHSFRRALIRAKRIILPVSSMDFPVWISLANLPWKDEAQEAIADVWGHTPFCVTVFE